MQRNDGTRNKKRTIVVKFLNFKSKSRILNAYRKKSHGRKKPLLTRISGGFSRGLAKGTKDLRLQNIVAKVVPNRLIAYEEQRGNDIFKFPLS